MIQGVRLLGFTFVLSLLIGCEPTVKFQNAGIEYDNTTRNVFGYLSMPNGKGPFPSVILLHTCGGVRSHTQYDWPNYLTDLGYAVLTVDSFGSRGLGVCPHEGSRGFEMIKDAFGALDYLAAQSFVDGSRIAVLGFSLGGSKINEIVMHRFRTKGGPNFRAAVSLYGNCVFLNTKTKPAFALMQIIGEKDNYASSCTLIKDNPAIEVHILPGIYHAFDQSQITIFRDDPAGNPMFYDTRATSEARELVRSFLAKHLGK